MQLWIEPDWPAPKNVKAITTLSGGDASNSPFGLLNLSTNVGDNELHVKKNRQCLVVNANLPTEPIWLQQVHDKDIVQLEAMEMLRADGAYTFSSNKICSVLTADCLPIICTNKQGTCCAAIHAGWRGLAKGIIATMLKKLKLSVADCLIWLGPAISQEVYQVDQAMYDIFCNKSLINNKYFVSSNGKWHADLYGLARQELYSYGIKNIFGGNFCTFIEKERFYSYRRQPITGRMATLIWLEN